MREWICGGHSLPPTRLLPGVGVGDARAGWEDMDFPVHVIFAPEKLLPLFPVADRLNPLPGFTVT